MKTVCVWLTHSLIHVLASTKCEQDIYMGALVEHI